MRSCVAWSAVNVISTNHRGSLGDRPRPIRHRAAASGPVFGETARGGAIGCVPATGGCRVVVRDLRGLEPSTEEQLGAPLLREARRSRITPSVLSPRRAESPDRIDERYEIGR